MIDTRIFKLKEGDSFKFKVIEIGKINAIVPAKIIWFFVRTSGSRCYYTNGIKEYSTMWKRPVFKM